MFKKGDRKAKRCGNCYSVLSAENIKVGFCKECAAGAIVKIKRGVLNSSIIGVNLVGFAFFMINYAKTHAYVNVENWDKRIYVRIAEFYMPLHEKIYNAIIEPSLLGMIITGIICFSVPFASYVRVAVFSSYYDLHENGADHVGNIILSFLLLFISGPFFLVHKLHKWWKVSNYIKTLESE